MNFSMVVTAISTDAPQFISKLKVSLACTSHQIGFTRMGIIFKYSKMVSFPTANYLGVF